MSPHEDLLAHINSFDHVLLIHWGNEIQCVFDNDEPTLLALQTRMTGPETGVMSVRMFLQYCSPVDYYIPGWTRSVNDIEGRTGMTRVTSN